MRLYSERNFKPIKNAVLAFVEVPELNNAIMSRIIRLELFMYNPLSTNGTALR